jgi:hypothetical protein
MRPPTANKAATSNTAPHLPIYQAAAVQQLHWLVLHAPGAGPLPWLVSTQPSAINVRFISLGLTGSRPPRRVLISSTLKRPVILTPLSFTQRRSGAFQDSLCSSFVSIAARLPLAYVGVPSSPTSWTGSQLTCRNARRLDSEPTAALPNNIQQKWESGHTL